MRAVEVPIVFRERERGRSKMSLAVILESMWRITAWAVVRGGSGARAVATSRAAGPVPLDGAGDNCLPRPCGDHADGP